MREQQFGGDQIEQRGSVLSLEQRLQQRDKHIPIRVVRDNPGIGELTTSELATFDPEFLQGGDMASYALVTVMGSNGLYDRNEFIERLSELDIIYENDAKAATAKEVKVRRVTALVENLLNAGLLKEQNSRIYSNIELIRNQSGAQIKAGTVEQAGDPERLRQERLYKLIKTFQIAGTELRSVVKDPKLRDDLSRKLMDIEFDLQSEQ